ncbi:glucosaminidase domain-containing protein [Riemerella anatipestifer]|uniref:Mannosyl-glycoprotein endo-beta-N-acetylglucosamidase-like domain-containing protein n=1 Tax=Riemerella anatipestifer RA-CH-1 TaxID=1228997 RepID=J9R6E4_RIEAN|nr:glucosaminidase domain-containing protein [Riemerella anatipestifer]AFR35327.1 hypothetical protein B739_0725 [Riemerella anatipestifer RA-CH-1]AIH02352.1 mannosyl-glycoprotein endo-beta-N-acetylglucosamidase [Riemerella anatipestifer CH3]MBO4233370.1 muramidase [Riemerella anatipestifer]MCO7332293.1 glucosaminidase domain-containing protein [Riemerella anatipestifer]MCO7351183.1 glucosaminidase domain-containing protein [Riemerella anatipestifer]
MKQHIGFIKTIIVGTFLCLFSVFAKAQTSHQYIKSNKNLATELSKKYEIPASVIMAIAFVETGGGSCKNSKQLNNHFGIVGKNHQKATKYKQFSSKEESFDAFCKMLTRKKYYAELKGNNDFALWIKTIANNGYSTQPKEWIRRLTLIYNKFNLTDL